MAAMIRSDYCPLANEPCQSMCEMQCAPMNLLTKNEIDDIIVDGSFHNAAGGIYANLVHSFAEAVQLALLAKNKKAR